jgi:hypothetical protein
MTGDEFRDQMGALLRTKYDNVRTEVQLTGKKADIYLEVSVGPAYRIKVGAECKLWKRPLTRDTVADIIRDYDAARAKGDIDHIWIICDQTPAAGARDYVSGYKHCQLMTAIECEQAIVDFRPLRNFLATDFRKDAVSHYYIPPSYYDQNQSKQDLHSRIQTWLAGSSGQPIAIWAGYGMGKTTYARFLASVLAERCLIDYGSRIPILLSLGEFTTAPDVETLIVTQLQNHYGVRFISSTSFRQLNAQGRFVLILDGFDEMNSQWHRMNSISSRRKSEKLRQPIRNYCYWAALTPSRTKKKSSGSLARVFRSKIFSLRLTRVLISTVYVSHRFLGTNTSRLFAIS